MKFGEALALRYIRLWDRFPLLRFLLRYILDIDEIRHQKLEELLNKRGLSIIYNT